MSRSRGNGFVDLRFEGAEAQLMARRTDAMLELELNIARREPAQAVAGALFGVGRARASARWAPSSAPT